MRSPIHSFLVALLALAAGGCSAIGVAACGSDSSGSQPRYTYVSPGATNKQETSAHRSAGRGDQSSKRSAPRQNQAANAKTVARTKTVAKPTTVTVPGKQKTITRTVTRNITKTVVVTPPPQIVTRTVTVAR
jgi:hypothetical protein